jgi:hypothetical protein
MICDIVTDLRGNKPFGNKNLPVDAKSSLSGTIGHRGFQSSTAAQGNFTPHMHKSSSNNITNGINPILSRFEKESKSPRLNQPVNLSFANRSEMGGNGQIQRPNKKRKLNMIQSEYGNQFFNNEKGNENK